ncbi:MAG: tRNA-dihydrouridine synthase family protein [Legionella sp.]|nr:tRNA-dihydrouridine synthase family protein [Legionella sp.]
MSLQNFINSPFNIASLTIPNRLIQGPLAGFSCAPFRQMYDLFIAPAYCVTEMSSAIDVVYKHTIASRYLYRSPLEKLLVYQISGHDGLIMAKAAALLQTLGADMIDINCGCPKTKIRKKGAGSALLETPQRLVQIVKLVKENISIPLTVKIRIQGNENDCILARLLEDAGADALIVHGRRWVDAYDFPCDLDQIAKIKQCIKIPVIANGDIADLKSLYHAIQKTGCDAFMISRAGTGRPWLYQELLKNIPVDLDFAQKIELFMQHLSGLSALEDAYKAVLQSKSLVRYYFKKDFNEARLKDFYALNCLKSIHSFLEAMNNTF